MKTDEAVATHSPHDVPRFYDISGITEDAPTFQLVVDLFVARYRCGAGASARPAAVRKPRYDVFTS